MQELQVADRFLQQLEELNLNEIGQARQLLAIFMNEGATQTEIANKCGVTTSAVTRNKNVFRGKKRRDGSGGVCSEELIFIESNPADERQKLLSPTAAGKRVREELTQTLRGTGSADRLRELMQEVCRELKG
jgi:DNA-binding MarR family transcriptional regulator